VRLNKAFTVRRGLSPRELLQSSQLVSRYMHYAICQKRENIWIAQREGRAKDSNDRTQPSLLKMMAMGGSGDAIERLRQLHLVPLAISYEYDPCDYLKAQEFQLVRDVEGWKKTKADDVLSMKTGILGFKGRIHYHCAPCIDDWLSTLDPATPKTELFDLIAVHIDSAIHRRYMIFPSNIVALDMLQGTPRDKSQATPQQWDCFEQYIEGQLAKISVPHKDEPFLRERLLTMYANPLINYRASQ
jgi:hypothetical protein